MPKPNLKVLVAGADLKFWTGLQEALEETGLFEFRVDKWAWHDKHDERQSLELLPWADVILAEWTLYNAVFYSRHKKPRQRMYVRFHLMERETPYPADINISEVDRVVFVGPHIEQEARQKFRWPAEKTTVIPNMVDCQRFDRPKHPGACFNLGIMGVVPSRKRLDLAVDLLELLRRRDNRWLLRVKGQNPADYDWLWRRCGEPEYYHRLFSRINSGILRNAIVYDPPGPDVPEWFQCVGFILSPSDFESFHMAMAEGLCSGTLPVLWNWGGAADIYDFLSPVRDVAEAAQRVRYLSRPELAALTARQCREAVRTRFDRSVVLDLWANLLTGASPSQSLRRQETLSPGPPLLIVVWAIDNWETFHRREMLEALARNLEGKALLCIIEPGNHYQAILEKGWSSRKNLSEFASLRPVQIATNIYRFRNLTGGFPADVAAPKDLEQSLRPPKIAHSRLKAMFFRQKRIIHWIYKPDQPDKLLLPDDEFIYEVYDEYTCDFASGELDLSCELLDRQVLGRARHVFCTSEQLLHKRRAYAKSISIAPNGVNIQAFAKSRFLPPPCNSHPKIGYLGNLSNFFNWHLILQLVQICQDYEFHFWGPIEKNKLGSVLDTLQNLEASPNVFFHGRVSREQGARSIAQCDVLIIPFVVNEAMDAVNPLKLWEYLAVGRPVVSSRLKAINDFSHIIRFADTPSQWASAITEEIEADNEIKYQQRTEIAAKYSWDRLASLYSETLLRSVHSL